MQRIEEAGRRRAAEPRPAESGRQEIVLAPS
jgi:hypothetical protein